MEPAHPQETLHGDNDDDGVSVTSWVSVCPRGLWKVQQKQTPCSTRYYPRMGSLCCIRVRLKANANKVCEMIDEKLSIQPDLPVTLVTETAATPFPRCLDSVLQVPLDQWTTLRLGEGQCDIIESCLESMRAGEKCELLLSPLDKGQDVSVPQPSDENLTSCATVELQAFTPGKESWEMSPDEKWEWVKSHKEWGGGRFRSGDVWGAAHSYSQAIKLLITLYGYVREGDKKEQEHEEEQQQDTSMTNETHHFPSANEFRMMKAELHSNMSLCQLKLNQPERAKASAAKATQLEPSATKAWYRLGQACQMVNELEEAKRAFRKLLELQPEFPAALKALKDIASKEKASNAQLGMRLSKMFS